MKDLQELRKDIDQLDRQMVELFEQRMEVCRQVAEYKIQSATKVLDRKRELEKLEAVGALAHNEFNRHGIRELFQQVMAMSRKLQYQLLESYGARGRFPFVMVDQIEREHVRVVYQGEEGAYTQQAMLEYFGEHVSSFHVEQWRDAMVAIAEGMADYAVLPIENSTAGIVSDIYDLLVEFDNYIVAEKIIPIHHALLGLPGAQISDIQTVYSHPQGLMQCSRFLEEHRGWQQVSMLNTAMAARKVLEDQDKSQAAIASMAAAKAFGLKVLKEHVNHSDTNSTRFIVATNQKMYARDAGKVSICFEVPHESGSLYNVLSHFIYNGLNMCRIESRPIPDRNWEYHFFVDFDGNLNDSAVKNALRGIQEEALNLKILGNY
ncbi:MAG: prephenate dehydratase [Lachnospiraceae bacterium]|jgi:chorismate mutase/prephenate dehydratase|nr:prephenate dehydratase [Lachnospiraceae bacterium]